MKNHTHDRYQEIYPGIYKIVLPLPGVKPGPVNAYLFTGKKVTLLDTGTLKTARILERVLKKLGLTFADIDQVILTHGHIDHYGAARKIIEGSKGVARLIAHKEDKNVIEGGWEVPRLQVINYYKMMGVPLLFQFSFFLLEWIFSSMAQDCRVDKVIADGDKILMGDYEATVVGTPGHTRGSVSLYLEKEGILFPGDHIMGHITPNAFVMLEADFYLPRRLSQVEYYDSLHKIDILAPRIVYPAHGRQIENVGETIAMFREQFSLRQQKILSILAYGDQTVYQIGRKLFPEIDRTRLTLEIFLIISEVYTHLQVLQKENKVNSCTKNGVLCFRL